MDALAARLERERVEVAVAERQLAIRRQELDDTIIRAPFAGVVVTKDAQPGEMISPVSAGGGFTRTGICTIVDMSSLEIEVDVNEAYINRVQPGQEVQATLDAYPDWRIAGARDHSGADRRPPEGDGQGAHRVRRARFADPSRHGRQGLVPGRGDGGRGGEPPAPVRWCRRRRCAPRASSRWRSCSLGDKVERRAIKVGGRRGDRLEVIAGLSPGRAVVVDGPPDLADGDRVTPKVE